MAARGLSRLLLVLLFSTVGALFWLSEQEAEQIQAQADQPLGSPPLPLDPGGLDHRDLVREGKAEPETP